MKQESRHFSDERFKQIGEVMRKYRKEKKMTQEEMAKRLGVSAPAVNKWENNVSLPDITLLAPIARLLEISLETLLSFQEKLTNEEIAAIVDETSERLQKEPYEDVFLWAKGIIEKYPNCENMIWQQAVLLDAQRIAKPVENEAQYDDTILKWYERGLESSDETIKSRAADSLSALYIRREQYEKAEECLRYFPADSPARRLKQALICSRTNRRTEAYKTYEEMMLAGVNTLYVVIGNLYQMAIEDKDMEKAHILDEKGSALTELFEMGDYNGLACSVQMAIDERDAGRLKKLMEQLLESVETIDAYRHSRLYEHMTFKELRPEFVTQMRQILKDKYEEELRIMNEAGK